MILTKENKSEIEINKTFLNSEDDNTKISFLKQHNYVLLGKLGELLRNGLPKNSTLNNCGVYAITKSIDYKPSFLTIDETKFRNNVISPWPEEKLKIKWVDNADILYYGLAGAKSLRSLRKRLRDLLNHGNGLTTDRGPHRGGEILWQLKGYDNFELWILPTRNPPEPRNLEQNQLKQFYQISGKLPFANRQF